MVSIKPCTFRYDERALFVTFNLTKLLHPGRNNALGAQLGNGKWGYLDIYANRSAVADQSGDSTRAFLMLLEVSFDNGTKLRRTTQPGSEGGWYSRHGPIVYDHLWHGEIYDRRLELSPPWATAPLADYPAGSWAKPARDMRPKVRSWLLSRWAW
jgi:alpha-L-rhamnosidase